MIDFHCHFLPGIDDGAKTPNEGIGILNELKRQGVALVCATPHFMAENMDIDVFLSDREKALGSVASGTDGIEIMLGAEVRITPELFDAGYIEKLCIGDTKTILLEMPYGPWQKWMFDLICHIKSRGIIPVIAHAERYFEGSLYKYKRFFEADEAVYMQFNAESFVNIFQRRAVRQILTENVLPVLGSDAHDLKERRPKMDKARQKILSRFDKELLSNAVNNARLLLNK